MIGTFQAYLVWGPEKQGYMSCISLEGANHGHIFHEDFESIPSLGLCVPPITGIAWPFQEDAYRTQAFHTTIHPQIIYVHPQFKLMLFLDLVGLVYRHFGKEVISNLMNIRMDHPDMQAIYLQVYKVCAQLRSQAVIEMQEFSEICSTEQACISSLYKVKVFPELGIFLSNARMTQTMCALNISLSAFRGQQ